MKRSSKISNGNSHRFRELLIITKISQSVIKTLDFEEILQTISDGMSELLEIETAAIYILESTRKLHLGATTPPLEKNMPDSLRKAYLVDHPHIKTAISTRKPLLIPDTKTENLTPAEKEIVEMRSLRSLLYFPFLRGKKVLGVLILGTCKKSRNYSESQIELGQTIANQLSVAIQNSQLHNDLKKYTSNLERLVEKRTRELKSANEELRAINEQLQNKSDLVIEKNKIVQEQKEEIENTLMHLKTTQAKLIQSEKMASLGILTAGIAHEINNPLNFIMGGYTGLKNELELHNLDKNKRISVFLKGIMTGIERATAIVSGLNKLNRDNDNYDENCDIHAILDNCLAILQNKFKNRISIIKNYNKDIIFTKGNTGKLHQVFINIISNAIDSIEQNGEIQIETNVNDNILDIVIKDNGCGISTENLKKVIDPFFTTKDPGKGTGLGLSISHSIIEQHKGYLQIESTIKKGTKVLVHLPKTM
jgi:C4-dicarboxylate-specific signal transduction histidine kinase